MKYSSTPMSASNHEAIHHGRKRYSGIPDRDTPSHRSSHNNGSLFRDIYNDLWKLPRWLYWILKWPLSLYLLWLITSYSAVYCYNKVLSTFEPICAVPLLGEALRAMPIPICDFSSPTRTINITRAPALQESFDGVMLPAGRNYDLAKSMVGHQHAVRDLRIRVKASELHRKKELEAALESLIRLTKDTAKYVDR